jgi:RNA polymerase sigma-70 factor (ECF subfamily)
MTEHRTQSPDGSPSRQAEPLVLFEILVRENADALTAFLRASVQDHAAADDLFQETMLVAWRRIGDYDRARPFGAWLRGIAKRLVLEHYRQSAREVPVDNEHLLDCLDARLAQVERQPGNTLDEKIAALRDCIQRLDLLYQDPIQLHYRERRTTDWIAEHLATTRDVIQKRLQRARVQLAECLERKGVLDPQG